MADTSSKMLPLGTKAPFFDLLDTITDMTIDLESLKGKKGTVIMFICNHCPFVIHVMPKIIDMAKEYQKKGISFIGISSNDVINYPQDAPHLMKKIAFEADYPFPYLYDITQKVAKSYDASCTPDFYLFNTNLILTYRGQLDDSRPGNGIQVSGSDLRNAIKAILYGEETSPDQKPSIGCGIKWKDNQQK
ncbi:MAG: thioredoxin family protein [Maribacter sp.]|nr:thioredoxin family protein [Maribacter sp.]